MDLLTVHQVEHHTGEFKCPECDAIKSTEAVLRRHIQGHANIKNRKYACSVCDKAHSTSYGLQQHKATHEPPTEKLTCPEEGCTAVFSTDKHRRRHVKQRHPSQEENKPKPARCLIQGCHKYLPSQWSVRDHARNKHPGAERVWCFDSTFRKNSARLDALVADADDNTRRRTPPPQ